MEKTHTNLSVDKELIQRAKEAGYNISALTEGAIRDRLKIKDISLETGDGGRCEICNMEGMKETRETVKDKNPRSVVWLYPDEIWICNSCLSQKFSKIAQ